MRIGLTALALILGVGCANANTITYTEVTTANGSLGSDPFSNTLVTLTGTGNTSDIMSIGGGDYVIPVSATVKIASLDVTATITSSIEVGVCTTCPDPDADFDLGGATILGTDNSAFHSYFLATAIGPITSDGTSVGFGEPVNTSLGTFEFTTPGTPVFNATLGGSSPVPEPNALMPAAAGLLALVLKRRGRKCSACSRMLK